MARKLTVADGTKVTEKYEVEGFEEIVPEIRKMDKQAKESMEKKLDYKKVILDKVLRIKEAEENKGKLYKTFIIKSSDGDPASILFKNQFSKLDTSNEPHMRKELGDATFDELFEKKKTTAIRSNADKSELKKLLGKRFDDFFDTKETLIFKKDFMERRSNMHGKLTKAKNAAIDKWTSENQAAPDLRLK